MTEQAPNKEINEGKFFALISYISFLCLVTLLLKKKNKFALYHAKQGLVIFVMEVALTIIAIIPFLGWIIWSLGFIILSLVCLWAILEVLMGHYLKIPLVSDIAEKIVI